MTYPGRAIRLATIFSSLVLSLVPSALAQRPTNPAVPVINTVAGTYLADSYSGDDGPATKAGMYAPVGVAVDSAGNYYIADQGNSAVRKVTVATGIITTVAGCCEPSGVNGYAGDGGPATKANLSSPRGTAVDSAGNIYIADRDNCAIRKVTAATGIITTVAGEGPTTGCGYSGDGGPATSAKLHYPNGVGVDSAGNFYIADYDNNVIRKVTVATGTITTVAGDGTIGYSGDGGPATGAELNTPFGVAPDSSGNLYIADNGNSVIRKVTASTGIISTVGGCCEPIGVAAYRGDGGPATSAYLDGPQGLAVDSTGNIYIADSSNCLIRKITTATGIINTVAGKTTGAGTGANCNYSGDGGPATSAEMAEPQATVVDSAGNLYIADTLSDVIRAVTPSTVQFVSVVPCRVVDTRTTDGPFGGPAIAAGTFRSFAIPSGPCAGISTAATAYSLNVTAVPSGALGYLTIWPAGETQPVVSTLNSPDGRIKANAAIVPAGTLGAVSVYASNTTNVVLDINGYFEPSGSTTLQFYPLTPCRVADTRKAVGLLGGPSLVADQERDFPVLSGTCPIPTSAQAYSLNFTVIPPTSGTLAYLTVWPQGQSKPLVSTLNDLTGTVVANAAIVPAGTGGGVAVYPSDATNLVIDVNGYFATPGTGGYSLYTLTPCRVLDTRKTTGNFSGELTVNVVGSACAPPSTAHAYVFNATAVPSGALGYLTLWPDTETQPVVSTLNALDGAITSNMAIVPNLNGKTDAFASGTTQLVLDISAYFAP